MHLDYSTDPDNTNTALLMDPKQSYLAPYTASPGIYKCPADKSSVRIANHVHLRARSYSMNSWMEGNPAIALVAGSNDGNRACGFSFADGHAEAKPR